jgi:hypothetical protein
MVVDVGEAIGLKILVLLNPAEGDHAYVPPPLPCNVVLLPGHIVSLVPASAITDRTTTVTI